MAPQIFITGAHGYVGGDFAAQLIQYHPDYQIAALVRNEAQAKSLTEKFPVIRPVIGSFDSREILFEEATRADVIVQIAKTDDETITFNLLEGAAANKENPATYIHISGMSNLIDLEFPPGEAQERIYGDIDNEAEILSLPIENMHAAIEQKLIATAEKLGVRAAILSLPLVYGQGRGPTPQNWFFKYYTNGVISHGRPFVVGAGKNTCNHSHVSDVSSAIEIVVVQALKGKDGAATWGNQGYYFVETVEAPFLQDAEVVGEVLAAHGLIKSTEIDHLDVATVEKYFFLGQKLWGSSERGRAQKLRAMGWNPKPATRAEDLRAMTEYEILHIAAA
jgi:nucleoside-diphosphate-sugar epimerase